MSEPRYGLRRERTMKPLVCKKCGQTLKRLMLLALLCDAGAKCAPHPLDCEHDFSEHE